MIKHTPFLRLAGIAAAVLFGASPAYAQSGSGGNPAASASQTGSAKIGKDDQKMIEDIAQANLAEIDTGKLALDKSKNEQVKKFAQMMIDDHTAAQKELQTLAQSKGVTLPTETDIPHKAISTALTALSGDTFDKQYIARVGVGDHQRTHDLLQKTMKNAKDADLKAYAQKTAKTVDQHLAAAKKMEGKQ